jgi:hypothetical protein
LYRLYLNESRYSASQPYFVGPIPKDTVEGSTRTFRLVTTSVPFFVRSENNTGQVFVNAPIDYETQPIQYLIYIDTYVNGIFEATLTLRLYIIDINDEPPLFNYETYYAAIDENSPIGTPLVLKNSDNTVVSLTVSDADSHFYGTPFEDSIFYDYKSVNFTDLENAPFVLLQNGSVFVSSPIDAEVTPFFTLRLKAVDLNDDLLFSFAYISVIIGDLNDNPPIFGEGSYSFTVSEDESPGYLIGTTIATDVDSTSEIIYST